MKTTTIFTHHRDGISIIEVLTSLLVATIGVFGVLILIPFAVQQAQLGLDQDAANIVGQNAFEDLQVYGFTTVEDNGQFNLLNAVGARFDRVNPEIIHFDPLGIGYDPMTGVLDANEGVDFLTQNVNMPPELKITVATGFVPLVGGFLSQAEANRLCRSDDAIIISDEDEAGVNLPQPVLDVSSGGALLRRQSAGRISWSAIYVPFKDTNRVKDSDGAAPTPVTRYKVYVLVYKDRDLTLPAPAVTVNRFATTVVAMADVVPPADQNGGYTPAVDLISAMGLPGNLSKDDWVMLINQKPAPAFASPVENLGLTDATYQLFGDTVRLDAEEDGYNVQLGFAKVIAANDTGRLTVAGGAFNFYFSDVMNTETYVVNLRDVINVYERTITLERNSTWN